MSKVVLNNHCFALFYKHLSKKNFVGDDQYLLTDFEIVYRINIVLRMQINDQCILFDKEYNMLCSIVRINKKEVLVSVVRYEKNHVMQPFIKLYLPLLKRVHLEDAISFAGQVGVSEIQLIVTEKSARTLVKDERLDRIMISACEQAKQYVVPRICEPIKLHEALNNLSLDQVLVCSQDGVLFSELQKKIINNHNLQTVGLFIGPEQDFTQEEYRLLRKYNISSVSLGSLVLQASIATCVAIGLLRASFITKK